MSEITISQPIGSPAAWAPVMTAAEFRCQCTGACGRTHTRSQGRCNTVHQGSSRLMVAPFDPTLTLAQAVQLPANELRAWCWDCHRLARRRTEQPADVPQTDSLF